MPARKKARRPVAKSARKKAAPKKGPAKKAAKRTSAPKRKAAPAKRAAAPALPPAPANAIGLQMQHMDFTTHDVPALRRFYVEGLGFSDANFDEKFQYLWIPTGHSSSLGFMPPMPGMGEPSPAKEPTIYLIVADVDKAYATLASRGVHFEGPPADMPWGHRVVSTVDPEGRRVMLATPKPMA
ncbi:MAG TPA: VOC family protein [Candidatus Eisenbacteria bacterium]|nr:VOC family protein [Candidatus Eisenbacteria bacterium]